MKTDHRLGLSYSWDRKQEQYTRFTAFRRAKYSYIHLTEVYHVPHVHNPTDFDPIAMRPAVVTSIDFPSPLKQFWACRTLEMHLRSSPSLSSLPW